LAIIFDFNQKTGAEVADEGQRQAERGEYRQATGASAPSGKMTRTYLKISDCCRSAIKVE
jgi:hypothetical protein